MGLSEPKARSLTHKSARRLPVLRRMLIDEAGGDPPQWVATASQSVVALVLLGQWDERSERDKELVAKLVGQPYEAIETDVAKLVHCPRFATYEGRQALDVRLSGRGVAVACAQTHSYCRSAV